MRNKTVADILKRCLEFVVLILVGIAIGKVVDAYVEKGSKRSAFINGEKNAATETDAEKIDAQRTGLTDNLKDEKAYYEYSNQKLAWWFKRSDCHGPSGCDDTVDISCYNAFYLDENVSEDDKVLYLTIDCGYDNGLTASMLDVLKKEDVKACFFVTQTYIRDNVELVKRMKEEGHQVGNHTISHPSLPGKSFADNVKELKGCYEYMKEATGYDMDPFFRPPSGEYSERTLAIANDMGYKTIFWSMAYLDYDVNKQPGADYVIKHFEKYHHNGAIILMHNVSSSNAQALETVIENLKAEGYRFATLYELDW